MTPTEIRIAMAELEGWVRNKHNPAYWSGPNGESTISIPIPDYANDLNSVHRVVNLLTEAQRMEFLGVLNKILLPPSDWFPKRIVESTPLQWCEACLRATGKWRD